MNESGMEYGGHFDMEDSKRRQIDNDARAWRIAKRLTRNGFIHESSTLESVRKCISINLREDMPTSDDSSTRRIAELESAAIQAFASLVGAHAADDSVQGRARDRLRVVLGIPVEESEDDAWTF